MKFIVMDHLPDGFFSAHPTELHTIFDGPTLIHLDFKKSETIFISVMLHGNEHSGFYAIREYLTQIEKSGKKPKRNLSILIGNVEAASQNSRFLDEQRDLNRIWSDGDTAEEIWAQNIYEQMSQRKLFATVDLHNNTGKNPHYCAVTNLETDTLRLASLFDGNILYFTDPKEVFSNYFSKLAPSLTIEAGQSGDREGIQKIIQLIHHVMDLDSFDNLKEESGFLTGKQLFESFGKIKIPPTATVSFDQSAADFTFDSSIENLNFNKVKTGFVFGRSHNIDEHLLVYNSNNELIGSSYFKYIGNEIVSIEDFYPTMITTNSKIVHQDCLCYLLREIIID